MHARLLDRVIDALMSHELFARSACLCAARARHHSSSTLNDAHSWEGAAVSPFSKARERP